MNDVVTPDSLTWATEQAAAASAGIDRLPTRGLVDLIVAHDAGVVDAVKAVAQQVTEAADLMVAAIEAGGVVHYVGAGTSGRLGILDAVELFPTYDAGPEVVRAHLAGGDQAMMSAVEGAEDDAAAGARVADEAGEHDLVVGIAASGRTPYVIGALRAARARGLRTVLVSMNAAAPAAAYADVAVLPDTGPEVVTGSTRMKAGTATKLVLNTMSTTAMVRLGRTYGNLMIDMRITNEKLAARSVRMLTQASGASVAEATRAREAAGDTRVALVALLAAADPESARAALEAHRRDSTRPGDPSGITAAARSLGAS